MLFTKFTNLGKEYRLVLNNKIVNLPSCVYRIEDKMNQGGYYQPNVVNQQGNVVMQQQNIPAGYRMYEFFFNM